MDEKKTAPWLCDEDGNPLDEKQIELAMTDDANLIINAGPGSGKTRVLVAHYLDLLMRHSDWDVESVVAITFTEKAAAEMKERINRVLLRARKEVPLPKWRDRIEEILEHLPEAPIGTIHSFCARLLRKFALKGDIDPSFHILDELEAKTLKIKVCERWLWSKLSDNSDPIALEAQKVVVHWGFNDAVNLLLNMLDLRLLVEYQEATGKNILCSIGGLEEEELALEQCYKHVADAYDNEKASINALDYDDLLIRTWKLLKEDDQVRHHLRRTHRRILVDELQDTDRVQVEILALICGWEENEPTQVLFFGVGDSQQSIYGFRNADVSVFNELWKMAGNRLGWRQESLDKNYRSVSRLVELTNYAFERIFKLSEKPDEVEQKVRTPLRTMQAVRQQSDDLVPIEFAFFKVESKVSEWQKLRLEADWIAKRILEFHESGVAYRDIALLLRKLVNASAFEDALRRYGIPYYIITGYGFFETMEARDLLAFLQVLSEPENDVALAAWLRSPMVGVSDKTLFTIFGSDSNVSLWLRGIAPEESIELPLTELEREKLKLAKSLLEEAQGKVDKVSVRELLEWIIRRTSYDTIAAALPHGRQRLANIKKFVRVAQRLNEEIRLDVRGLTRYARSLLESEVRIGEPPLAGATADAVQVMTIHAAKGLEFPVVIVPMLGEVSAPAKTKKDLTFAPEKGLAVKLKDETGKIRNPRFDAVEEIRQLRETAELERLLFVAWTRAKDRLILVGTKSEENQKKQTKQERRWESWLQLIVDTLQIPIGEKQDEPFLIAGKIPVRLMGETVKTDELPHKFGKPMIADVEAVKWLERPETIPDKLPETPKLDLPISEPSVLRLHVTDLIEGELKPMASSQPLPASIKLSPQEAGLIVHFCLERKLVQMSNEQIRWIAQTVGADPDAALSEAEVLRKFVEKAARSQSWLQAEIAPQKWHELDFRIWLDGQPPIELAGRWDLIVKGEEWLIVDFKTDKIASVEDAESRVDGHYLVQAQAYALAAHRIFGAESVKFVFVFVNSPEPCEVIRQFTPSDWGRISEILRRKSLHYVEKVRLALLRK